MRRRGQGSGGARPRSGRRALTPSPFGACCAVVEGLVVGLLGSALRVVDVAHIRAGACRWEQALVLLGHPYAA